MAHDSYHGLVNILTSQRFTVLLECKFIENVTFVKVAFSHLKWSSRASRGRVLMFWWTHFVHRYILQTLSFQESGSISYFQIPFLVTRSSILLYHSTTTVWSELGLGFRPEYQRICDENTLHVSSHLRHKDQIRFSQHKVADNSGS